MTTVLVTGAAGYIAGYDLRLVDNRAAPGVPARDLSDPTDLDRNRDLFRGADAVVHLAFLRPAGPTPRDRYFAERGNVDMAYAVYQLALEEGVRRVVVA